MNARILTLGITLAATIALTGCPSANQGLTPKGQGTVNGQVSNQAADDPAATTQSTSDSGVPGATVAAFQVSANGQLTPVSGQVTTDASGQFSLQVPADTPNLVLQATKDQARWMVIVSQGIAASSESNVKPMTQESSVEARVFAQMVAQGAKADSTDTLDVMNHVSADVALKAGSDEQAIAHLAQSIEREQEARLMSYKAQGKSDTDLALAYAGEKAAYATLGLKLRAAATAQAAHQAFMDYQNAVVQAGVQAGVTAETQMQAEEAGAAAEARFAGQLGQDVRLAVFKTAAERRSELRALAASAALKAMGASDAQQQAAAQAATNFQASIQAATSLDSLNQAFQSYHTAMVQVIQATLSETGHSAAVSGTMQTDSSLNASTNGTIGASLQLGISSAVDGPAVAGAYQQAASGVQSQVQVSSTGLDAQALTTAMLSSSVQSGF